MPPASNAVALGSAEHLLSCNALVQMPSDKKPTPLRFCGCSCWASDHQHQHAVDGDDLGFTWAETVESFRDSVMTGRNQIRAETWRDNYQPYLKEALRLLGSSNKPKDGFTLQKRTLQRREV